MGISYAVEKYTDAVRLLAGSGELGKRLQKAGCELSLARMHVPPGELSQRHNEIEADLTQIYSPQMTDGVGTLRATIQLLTEEELSDLADAIVWQHKALVETWVEKGRPYN